MIELYPSAYSVAAPPPEVERAWDRPNRDMDALPSLYAELGPKVQRFLVDMLRDSALAADATQETFVRAFQVLPTLSDETPVRPWIFGIARNVAKEMLRSRERVRRIGDAVTDAAAPSLTTSPENDLLGREAVNVVARALAQLSEDRRAVLVLRLDHDLSYDEIAGLMSWPVSKVKSEIFRARQLLRTMLEEYEGGAS